MTNESPAIPTDPFFTEIGEQPEALVSSARSMLAQSVALAALREAVGDDAPIVLTGMGSSYDALSALASVFSRTGRSVSLVNSAELLHFGRPALRPGSVVVVVSQSGESAEAVLLADALAAAGECTLVAVCNGADSALARASDILIDIAAGRESGPSTKTFTASLVALAAIERTLREPRRELAGVLDEVEHLAGRTAELVCDRLRGQEAMAAYLADWGTLESAVAFVGRGVGLAAAELGALIMKEAAQLPAISMDAAEFRHGPLELAGPGLSVVVVAIEETMKDLDERLVADLAAAGSPVIVVGPAGLGARYHLPTESVDPFFDVIQAAIPLQLMTWAIAADKHEVPGVFRVGAKVTASE